MSGFSFVGAVPAAKSIFARALVVKSFFPELILHGESKADEVVEIEKALRQFQQSQKEMEFNGDLSGLHSLVLRLARRKGAFALTGAGIQSAHRELERVLAQLGCTMELVNQQLKIQSWEWKMVGDGLHISGAGMESLASAVLLSGWGLPFDLGITLGSKPLPGGPLSTTLRLLTGLGMKIENAGRELRIPRDQQLKATDLSVEPDMGLAFALAACAAVGGRASFVGFPEASLQPEAVFVMHLKAMGVPIEFHEGRLDIHRAHRLLPIQSEMGRAVGLNPVLAALAALAEGESHFYGISASPEIHPLDRTVELLRLAGREVLVFDDGLRVSGACVPVVQEPVWFQPDHNPHLAMAAAVLNLAGEPIQVLEPQVVAQSFPEFWSAIGKPL